MEAASTPRILLCADAGTNVADVRQLLAQAAYQVDDHALGAADPASWTTYHAVIVEATHSAAECRALCQRLRAKLGDAYLPSLVITADPSPAARLASLESGADAYLLRPFDPAELLAQLRAF